jgi:molybdenum cofactor cytidylyltransferase
VRSKQIVATVKIIPFAVTRVVLEKVLGIVAGEPLLRVASFKVMKPALIITRLPQTKQSIIEKSEGAIRQRLALLGNELATAVICDHAQDAIATQIKALRKDGCSPILVFGASAIVDRADVIPAGLVEAGGEVLHLGMPVDPGNLMMLGQIGDTTVIGVPSCARSPKTNGFDWVLERTLAGLKLSREDVMDMGAGGLLAEISSRPQPREKANLSPRVAGVVLAAGLSSRMGTNKMLADYCGEPMLRASVRAFVAAGLDEVFVVTGHEPDQAGQALEGLKVTLVHNAQFATGLASSVRAGVAAATSFDAVIIGLGDMPRVSPQLIKRLVAAYNPVEHRSIVMPVHRGEIGNPVLWGADYFNVLLKLEGDRGARALIAAYRNEAVEIEAGDDGVLIDADTPEALHALTTGLSP